VLNIIWEIYTILEEEEGEMVLTAFQNEVLSVGATVKQLDAGKYWPEHETPASRAVITVESRPIRFWYHPDQGEADDKPEQGHLARAGSTLIIAGLENIQRFRAVRAEDADAILKVTYER